MSYHISSKSVRRFVFVDKSNVMSINGRDDKSSYVAVSRSCNCDAVLQDHVSGVRITFKVEGVELQLQNTSPFDAPPVSTSPRR